MKLSSKSLIPPVGSCHSISFVTFRLRALVFFAYALCPGLTGRAMLAIAHCSTFARHGGHLGKPGKRAAIPTALFCAFQAHFGYRYLTRLFLQEAGKNKPVKSHRTLSGVLRTFSARALRAIKRGLPAAGCDLHSFYFGPPVRKRNSQANLLTT